MVELFRLTMAFSPLKRVWTKGLADLWSRSKRSALNVSRFFSRKPWACECVTCEGVTV